MLDRLPINKYMRLPYKYQSKIGYDTLIQNVTLKDLINRMGTTITDLDIELKMKISRIKYLENKTISQIFKSLVTIYIQYLVVLIHDTF